MLFSAVIFIVTGRSPAPIAMTSAVGGPFKLVDQNAKPITDQDLKGQPFLVFFGFTHCPDVCPTTLFEVSEIFRALGPDAKNLRALFVTVDPERDTPAVLKDYLSSFDPRIKQASPEAGGAIATAEKDLPGHAKKVPIDGGGYTMDHTAIVYLMNKEGRFVAPFNMKRRPDEAGATLLPHNGAAARKTQFLVSSVASPAEAKSIVARSSLLDAPAFARHDEPYWIGRPHSRCSPASALFFGAGTPPNPREQHAALGRGGLRRHRASGIPGGGPARTCRASR